jgi:hypothetical protein
MPWPVAYVADLLPPSDSLIDKIHRKHGVTLDEVREAVILTEVDSSFWVEDEARGPRLQILARTYAGRRLLVILYPVDVDEGIWRLGTAMEDK